MISAASGVGGDDDDDEAAGYFEKLGAKTEYILEKFFTAWGTRCAQHPASVLFAGLLFVIALGLGIMFLHVTTDPVELWASPASRSRVEREYFDSHFEPFYRIEQIIIKAQNLPNVVYKTDFGDEIFGPVFNRDFLLQIYQLQKDIKG